jgi:hypothetical protein
MQLKETPLEWRILIGQAGICQGGRGIALVRQV